MPSEMLFTTKTVNSDTGSDEEATVTVKESEVLTALRVEANEQMLQELDQLKTILTNVESTVDEKNNAYEKMKLLNITRGEEENLESKILEEFNLKAFAKIDGDQIRIVVASEKHDTTLANNIMRSIQSGYDKKMYISVKFQK